MTAFLISLAIGGIVGSTQDIFGWIVAGILIFITGLIAFSFAHIGGLSLLTLLLSIIGYNFGLFSVIVGELLRPQANA